MKKYTLPVALLTTLFISGCSSTGSGSNDGTLMEAFSAFVDILDRTQPFVQESEQWDQYSIEKSKKGLTYSPASSAEKQFVAKKMDSEFGVAIDKLERSVAITDDMQKELDAMSKKYQFTYNQVMAVKDKSTANTLGYCVNFDSIRYQDGKLTPVNTKGNLQKHFIYLTKDQPLSISTSGDDFIKRMCGIDFYNQFKK